MKIYPSLLKDAATGKKKFIVLIDPDKHTTESVTAVIDLSISAGVDCFFLGGSLLVTDNHRQIISLIKKNSGIPVILFPGNNLQLDKQADGILLLSLISGRNPEMLIGRHVISAPFLKSSKLEILPTGYMLIDSGTATAVNYMSNTTPIPSGQDDIAACTALAGEMLGMKIVYLDAGSGAPNPVPVRMITRVKQKISIPLIVGGGITSPELARKAWEAGADIVVVGNAIELDPGLIIDIARIRDEKSKS